MEAVSAAQMFLEASKSAELVALFRAVAEADAGGELKYSPAVSRDLAKTITCRSYAPAVLELCHLVNIADASAGPGGRWEMLFWGVGVARSAAFHGRIIRSVEKHGWRREGFTATAPGIEARYADGRFTVTYARMPFLTALMEFLVSALDYPGLDDIFRRMIESGPTQHSVSEHANQVSRMVYDYLRDHLPTAQNQRKFHSLIGYMQERAGADFNSEAIDDAVVLDFWRVESLDASAEGVDFKTFQTVFKSFVRLRQTLDQAGDLYALSNPKVIGSDREAGEVDPDSLRRVVETIDAEENPLLRLLEPPASAVKFLNKREAGTLELLMECGRAALDMPLSLMRCEVFGKAQARITQALRRKLQPRELDELLSDPASSDYAELRDEFAALVDHLRRVLLASLHLLTRVGSTEAASLLLAIKPDVDLSPLRNLVKSRGEAAGRVLAVLEDPARAGPDIAGLMAEARTAFRSISRQGFSEDVAGDAEGREAFSEGTRAVMAIGKHLKAFQNRLDRHPPEGGWPAQYRNDLAIFSRQFHLLYGEPR